jgi:murein DD-endopeptidase MepM/ murein hydrolase activator NlpD
VKRRQPKHHRGARLLVFLILLVPLVAGSFDQYSAPPAVRGDELSDALARQKALAAKIAAQKKQLAALNALQGKLANEIADTRDALVMINADLVVAQKRVTKATAEVNVVRAQYNELVASIAELDAQIEEVAQQERVKEIELGQRKAMLASRLRAAYATGETSLLETILSARSFSDALADVGYYLDIGDQDKALAEQIRKDSETLATLNQTLSESRVQANELRIETAIQKRKLNAKLADLKDAKAQLVKLQKETKRQLAIQAAAYRKISQNKAAAKAALAAQARANANLKHKIARLIAAQFASGNIPSVYNGTLRWPLHGTITQEFGCTGFVWEPPYGNCAHYHNGIDIAAPKYTPIRAAGSGRVVYAGPLSDGAWVVIIAHSQHLVTLYGHLDNHYRPPTVRAGQIVAQGKVIGYVGMTGNTTGPHLHWSVELNGTWVNPRLFL